MFSIKHIGISGDEQLYQAESVFYKPPTDNPARTTPGSICLDHKDLLWGGTIFVMNDAGKTVARYDLGASPVPLDEQKAIGGTLISGNTESLPLRAA